MNRKNGRNTWKKKKKYGDEGAGVAGIAPPNRHLSDRECQASEMYLGTVTSVAVQMTAGKNRHPSDERDVGWQNLPWNRHLSDLV
ncbi:hypothetical protein E2C01_085201 [Portunus trituberculatus]|uniref:Uncharacterized protein n=1 Tax=Portunus trituberculatus TaxID=210409 RepID=A0A5B7J9U0_PORTR|nr:hypothetical protein [Portunus trituberculatus]